jgi:two-component system, NtrC family, sensor histidine kinase KinB
MKNAISLRTRFIVAGALLVGINVATSAYSAWAFSRVSDVVDLTVRGEQTTAVTGTLISALEREDDALLQTSLNKKRGRPILTAARRTVEGALRRFETLLASPEKRGMASHLRSDIEGYHAAGDKLLAATSAESARALYNAEVNPLLGRAVGAVADVREDHFRSTEDAATWARDQARQSNRFLLGVSLVALLLSIIVSMYLASVVIPPIQGLTNAVEAMRRGEFDFRVSIEHHDEIGRLAEGFNRMADALAAFRRANIGEVMRAKETLEAALAALPDAVVVIESTGEVSSANPRASEVIEGLTSKGARLQELSLPEATKAAIGASLRGEIAKARSVDLSNVIPMRIGKEDRRLLPRIVPIRKGPNHQQGAVLILSDLTDFVRLDEMRMELVAVASHELRTPLTTLRMTLLMLKERAEQLEERDRALVSTALFGAEQLSDTIAKFLDLTQIEAGQLRLQRGRVDLQTLLAEGLRAVDPSCKEAGIGVSLEIGPDLPQHIWGDAGRLSVVLSNVLTNAIKYTPPGGRIHLGATPDNTIGKPAVYIEITDSGPGVDPEFHERVFEKFFRVEHHRPGGDQGARGSGIGLYIAREIVRAHGGTITCLVGREALGARFAISLPVDQVAS